ncbi:MAG: DUF72 domain-containing protein [Desulfatiglandales bacterium]
MGYEMDSGIPTALDNFDFRGLHPLIYMGTASDRYAGWIGQVYTAERYEGSIKSRTHKVGGKAFTEKVLPVESVVEYFQHFRVLELDFTFYNTLLDGDGKPTPTYHTLSAYARFLPEGGRLLLKVPQVVFARKLRGKEGYADNRSYLDVALYRERFYEPALRLLSTRISGFVFEQEYQRSVERASPDEFARDLDCFFSSIPRDGRYHVEIRTAAFLAKPVLEVMEAHGVGQVFSHWTWLPPLSRQFQESGGRFLNERRDSVVRLMTPRGMRYEEAYQRAHPFDSLVPGMLDPKMVADTVRIMEQGVKEHANTYVVVNNRSGGNAPLIAREIARRCSSML